MLPRLAPKIKLLSNEIKTWLNSNLYRSKLNILLFFKPRAKRYKQEGNSLGDLRHPSKFGLRAKLHLGLQLYFRYHEIIYGLTKAFFINLWSHMQYGSSVDLLFMSAIICLKIKYK